MNYIYGMWERPVDIGCQPEGFVDFAEDTLGIYHNIIFYNRPLTSKELYDYEMDFIGVAPGRSEDMGETMIEIDRDMTDDEFLRLCRLFEAKFRLESDAFSSPSLSIQKRGNRIFMIGDFDGLEKPARDYLSALSTFAISAKRVNAPRPWEGGSEKYAFRTWLTRIGLGGSEFKETRKALTKDLPGSATRAHK